MIYFLWYSLVILFILTIVSIIILYIKFSISDFKENLFKYKYKRQYRNLKRKRDTYSRQEKKITKELCHASVQGNEELYQKINEEYEQNIERIKIINEQLKMMSKMLYSERIKESQANELPDLSDIDSCDYLQLLEKRKQQEMFMQHQMMVQQQIMDQQIYIQEQKNLYTQQMLNEQHQQQHMQEVMFQQQQFQQQQFNDML